MLDLNAAIDRARAEQGESPIDRAVAVREDLKTIFIAPSPPELPDDGVLQYTVVTSIWDVREVADRTVMLLDVGADADLLKLICSNGPLLGLSLRVLAGLPGSHYSVEFDSITWELERVAYAPFLSEIRLAAETEQQRRASLLSGHDVERQQYVRSDGSVRVDGKIGLASAVTGSTTEDESDDEEYA